jgi:hypothetical protein
LLARIKLLEWLSRSCIPVFSIVIFCPYSVIRIPALLPLHPHEKRIGHPYSRHVFDRLTPEPSTKDTGLPVYQRNLAAFPRSRMPASVEFINKASMCVAAFPTALVH